MIALDTNILVYVEGVNSREKSDQVIKLLGQIDVADMFVPVQVFGELFNVLIRKSRLDAKAARERVAYWMDSVTVIPTYPETMYEAMEISISHQVPIWDAVMLAAANSIECQLLLSEDFQHGFRWGGVTVVNPFAPERHWLLESIIKLSDLE